MIFVNATYFLLGIFFCIFGPGHDFIVERQNKYILVLVTRCLYNTSELMFTRCRYK